MSGAGAPGSFREPGGVGVVVETHWEPVLLLDLMPQSEIDPARQVRRVQHDPTALIQGAWGRNTDRGDNAALRASDSLVYRFEDALHRLRCAASGVHRDADFRHDLARGVDQSGRDLGATDIHSQNK